MTRYQDMLNRLYGSEIESIDYNSSHNALRLDLLITDGDKPQSIALVFSGVSNYKIEKDWADETWDVISVAEIFYIPELGKESSIDDTNRRDYNFLIDGDGFKIFINAIGAEILDETAA